MDLTGKRIVVTGGAGDNFDLAAERHDGSDPINIGTGDEIAIRDLARQIAHATGFEGDARARGAL
jgi:nucleoside-diphosphate-sugar epimerase